MLELILLKRNQSISHEARELLSRILWDFGLEGKVFVSWGTTRITIIPTAERSRDFSLTELSTRFYIADETLEVYDEEDRYESEEYRDPRWDDYDPADDPRYEYEY